ncbi:hypothetical protein ANCDUO_01750 [Ancylostoma duodenale]|uniref:Uncharacterized protein n=1 Tax=Ancylostoma duodenale TaxID=51022 RepID=A0A0C2DY61_9BILA|nr:hypothetical protein ANCDUO_01750 [Ancylostoma duodenale]
MRAIKRLVVVDDLQSQFPGQICGWIENPFHNVHAILDICVSRKMQTKKGAKKTRLRRSCNSISCDRIAFLQGYWAAHAAVFGLGALPVHLCSFFNRPVVRDELLDRRHLEYVHSHLPNLHL